MKKLMKEIFSDLENIYPDFKVIGKDAIVSFDKDRYAKIRFTKYASASGAANSNVFNGVVIDINDRKQGNLDSHTIAFSDVFDSIFDLNHQNKIGKHIWNDGKKYTWYGRPTKKDLSDLYNTVVDYLEFAQGKDERDKMISEQDKDNNEIKIIIEGGMVTSVLSNSKKAWDIELIELDAPLNKGKSQDIQEYVDSLMMSGEYKEEMHYYHNVEEENKDKSYTKLEDKISKASNKVQIFNTGEKEPTTDRSK